MADLPGDRGRSAGSPATSDACCAREGPPAGLFLDGASGALRVPVPSVLIEHPHGTVLFDTGMHPTLGTDPAARLGPQAGLWTVAL